MCLNHNIFFILLLCNTMFTSVSASTDEVKNDPQNFLSGNFQTIEKQNKKTVTVIPWTDERYSMKVLRPAPFFDFKILKNNPRPDTNYEIVIVDPYSKIKRYGYNWPRFRLRQR